MIQARRPQPYDLGAVDGPRQPLPPTGRAPLVRTTDAPARAADGAPNGAPSRQVSSKRRRISSAVLSGLAGFVLGAIFWHLVGFWSFVSHVVLKGPDGRTANPIETGSLPPAHEPRAAPRNGLARYKQPAARPDAAPAAASPAVATAPTPAPQTAAAVARDAGPPSGPTAGTAIPTAMADAPPQPAGGWTTQVDAGGTDVTAAGR